MTLVHILFKLQNWKLYNKLLNKQFSQKQIHRTAQNTKTTGRNRHSEQTIFVTSLPVSNTIAALTPLLNA